MVPEGPAFSWVAYECWIKACLVPMRMACETIIGSAHSVAAILERLQV